MIKELNSKYVKNSNNSIIKKTTQLKKKWGKYTNRCFSSIGQIGHKQEAVKKCNLKQSKGQAMMQHTFDPSTRQAEAGRSLKL